jgi:hypothetical protein
MTTDDDLNAAINRLARTADGRDLYLYLQKAVLSLASGDRTDGALREHEGRRMFAADLMRLMETGIEESGGRDNQPIVFSKQQRSAAVGNVSARDYFRKQLADESAGDR